MPVFDFVDKPKEEKKRECTYTVFSSNEPYADEKHPILILDHSRQEWKHHSNGTFLNQNTQTAFAFDVDGMTINADILRVDAQYDRGLCSLPHPRNGFWWWHQVICGGRFFTVYDGEAFCKSGTGRSD